MSVYKVPQDVEADDKIIGPFTFRQFIYLIAVALAIGLAWGLGSLFLPLAAIPLPVIAFFGALALPLKKDQPMEVFMAAILSFYLKPRRRLWDPDGIESLVEITAPKTIEPQRVKNISQDEARRRLSYLSDIVDSQGLSVKGFGGDQVSSPLQKEVYAEAQQTEDILDEEAAVIKRFDSKLQKNKTEQRDMMSKIVTGEIEAPNYFNNSSSPETPAMAEAKIEAPVDIAPEDLAEEAKNNNQDFSDFNEPTGEAPNFGIGIEPSVTDQLEDTDIADLNYNPYPEIQQTIIQPLDKQDQIEVDEDFKNKPKTAEKTKPQAKHKPSQEEPLPDIINLATNDDLSIATIAREANRIHEKQDLEEEVVISLR